MAPLRKREAKRGTEKWNWKEDLNVFELPGARRFLLSS